MKHPSTPQQKKSLSYSRDGRNTVAESRGIAHKAIAKGKAAASQALRRAQTVATTKAGKDEQVDPVVARVGRKSFRKIPDAPLAEYVAARLKGRGNERKVSAIARKAGKVATPRASRKKGPLQ